MPRALLPLQGFGSTLTCATGPECRASHRRDFYPAQLHHRPPTRSGARRQVVARDKWSPIVRPRVRQLAGSLREGRQRERCPDLPRQKTDKSEHFGYGYAFSLRSHLF
jgi:hypothetical protein